MPPVPNPAWIDKAIAKHWGTMEAEVGADWMPRSGRGVYEDDGFRSRYDELGAGHYGAVFRTKQRGVVVKITSDPTEARFIVSSLSLRGRPRGIVGYYDILRLPGGRYGRPIYAIWREEAVSTGQLVPGERSRVGSWRQSSLHDPYLRGVENEFRFYMDVYYTAAHILRERSSRRHLSFRRDVKAALKMDVYEEAAEIIGMYQGGGGWDSRVDLKLRHYRKLHRIAVALEAMRLACEMMEHTPWAVEVGETLAFYLNHGIVLADLHRGNLGQVKRGSDVVTVVTDPGHSIFLDGRFDALLREVGLLDEKGKTPKARRNPGEKPKRLFHRLMRI